MTKCPGKACMIEKRASCRVKRRRFTLIEVMMAFMLTAVTIAAAVGVLKTSLWAASFFSHRATASNIANSRMERLRSMGFANLDAMEEDSVPVNDQGSLDSEGHYERTTTIGNEYISTREVTVTVDAEWRSGQSPLTVSVSSIIADETVMR